MTHRNAVIRYGHNRIHRRRLNLKDLSYFSDGRTRTRGNSFSTRGRSGSTAAAREGGSSGSAVGGVAEDGGSGGMSQRARSTSTRGLMPGHEHMSLRQIVLEYIRNDVGADGTADLKTFGDNDAGQRRVLYRCDNSSSGGQGVTVSVLLPLEELKEHPERVRPEDEFALTYYVMKCDNRNRFPRMTLPLQQRRTLKDVLEDNRRLGFSHLVRAGSNLYLYTPVVEYTHISTCTSPCFVNSMRRRHTGGRRSSTAGPK